MHTIAYQVADSIDLKAFKSGFPSEVYYEEPDEVFYELEDRKYIYVFKYGVVCFLNFDELKIAEFIQLLTPFCRNKFELNLSEELLIETGTSEN
ncbi:MAG TPA: hypothetical protein VK166_00790, partial [Chitinophagaceae bacterium]|nr:hypothetical protein [Chitinophagaceae bacterium]